MLSRLKKTAVRRNVAVTQGWNQEYLRTKYLNPALTPDMLENSEHFSLQLFDSCLTVMFVLHLKTERWR